MKPQDELWWACLDGEMTPAEAAQYDKTLTGEDHRLMSAEMEMERGLGGVLSRPAPHADAAWHAALARVKAQKQEDGGRSRWRRRLVLAAIPAAMAAVALVVLGMGHARTEAPKPWFLSVNAREASEQASSSQAKEVMATVRTMLRDSDMHMAFDPGNSLQAADATCRLVSVRRNEHAGEAVLEMVFMCDGKPAKVIIANGSGAVAREISLATARGAALVSRTVGDWLVTAVGVDAPNRLLSLIQTVQPEPQGQPSPVSEMPQAEMSAPEIAVAAPETTVEIPEHAGAVPQHAAGVPNATVAPQTAVAVPNAAAVAPDTAVVPPDTAVVPPQSAPGAAHQPPASSGQSKPVDTMI